MWKNINRTKRVPWLYSSISWLICSALMLCPCYITMLYDTSGNQLESRSSFHSDHWFLPASTLQGRLLHVLSSSKFDGALILNDVVHCMAHFLRSHNLKLQSLIASFMLRSLFFWIVFRRQTSLTHWFGLTHNSQYWLSTVMSHEAFDFDALFSRRWIRGPLPEYHRHVHAMRLCQ